MPHVIARFVLVFSALSAIACAKETPVAPKARPLPAAIPSAETFAALGGALFGPSTIAVIGDYPYGPAKLAEFPQLIAAINGDPAVSLVLHLGDVKQGKHEACTDAYFINIRSFFDAFDDPLIFTPGDNEWTDCHVFSKDNGLYTPTERLQFIRPLFFPVPGQSLGLHKKYVLSEAFDPANSAFVENTMWFGSGVLFAAINITGSNNDLASWGTPLPADASNYPSQATEVATRNAANSVWIDRAFAAASLTRAAGVVLMFQADMWDTTEPALNGFDGLVQQIGSLAAAFGKPVLLLEGDSHIFRVDYPFSAASPLHSIHPSTPVAENVTRVVVWGSNVGPTEYLRLTIDPRRRDLFSWERVPLAP